MKKIEKKQFYDNLLLPEETSKRLRVTVGTLALWRCNKRYPLDYVKIGGKVLYKTSSIEKFINDMTVLGVG